MSKVVKKRNWAFVAYPTELQLKDVNSDYNGSDGYGSLPDDWLNRLQLTGLQYAISPLHDKDLNADGSIKKPHYHIILIYGSPTTFNNVNTFTGTLNATVPQALEQVKGYYRYFTHKDNPEKAQYCDDDIVVGGGFNISDYIELTKSEVTRIMSELQGLIRNLNINEYSVFTDYLLDNELIEQYGVAISHTLYFNAYITSRRHKALYNSNSEDKQNV